MNLYAFVLFYLPLLGSEPSHQDFYYEILNDREVTSRILNERLHVIDRKIDMLKPRLLESNCPTYLYATRVMLLRDKDMIEQILVSLKKH